MSFNKEWYYHYLKRIFSDKSSDLEKPFVEFIAPYIPEDARIIECGCGVGRSASALARHGYSVVAIDSDSKLVNLANDIYHDLVTAGRLAFAQMNIFNLSRFFKNNAFDACTHSGVLEHYKIDERKLILNEQLRVTSKVFLSVPCDTKFTRDYFTKWSDIWRELKNYDEWEQEFSQFFKCLASTSVRQRTDNAFFLLEVKNEDSQIKG